MASQFECPQSGCSFMIRANDEDEIIQHVREHAQDKHGMAMDENDIRQNIQEA